MDIMFAAYSELEKGLYFVENAVYLGLGIGKMDERSQRYKLLVTK